MAEKPKHSTALDVGAQQVAAVYAKAFLAVAVKANRVDAFVEEFDGFVGDVLDKLPKFEKLLASAFVSHEDKEKILDKSLGGRASAELVKFLKVLSAHGRLGILHSINRELHKQYNELRKRKEVTIRTASPLAAGLRKEITDRLRAMLSIEPILTEIVDPSLVGGVIIQAGDTVFDGSVQSRLQRAKEQMIHEAVSRIELSRERFLQGVSA